MWVWSADSAELSLLQSQQSLESLEDLQPQPLQSLELSEEELQPQPLQSLELLEDLQPHPWQSLELSEELHPHPSQSLELSEELKSLLLRLVQLFFPHPPWHFLRAYPWEESLSEECSWVSSMELMEEIEVEPDSIPSPESLDASIVSKIVFAWRISLESGTLTRIFLLWLWLSVASMAATRRAA